MLLKLKKSNLKSFYAIVILISILFITGGIAVVPDEKAKVDTIKKEDNKVKTNNSFFELQWDFDVTGYGADGLFYLKSSNLKVLDKNRSVYIGLLFPSLISNNNKILIEQKEIVKQVTQKSVFCDTAKYGWQVFNQQIWCNSTQTKFNNVTLQNESNDTKNLYDITADNFLIPTATNLTAYYNITTITEQFIKRDLSISLIKTEDKDIKTYIKKLNKDFSDLGSQWLLVNQPINLTLGETNIIEFKIDVNKSLLPLKYSVVIIDADDNSYIIIDPTIVNARTWSTNDDFTNGTVVTNLTTGANSVTLTGESTALSQNGTVAYYALDNVYTDNTTNVNSLTVQGSPVFNTTAKLGSHSWQGSGSNQWANKTTPTKMPVGLVDWSVSTWFQKGGEPASNNVIRLWGIGYALNDVNVKHAGATYLDDAGTKKLQVSGRGYGETFALTLNNSFWYHWVVTYTASTKVLRFYLNNDLIFTSAALGTGIDMCNNANNGDCVIYLAEATNQINVNTNWKGVIDELGIFNYTLTAADVTALWNSGNALAYPLTNAAKTHGEYSDRQGWLPQSGNQISNMTITVDNSSGGNVRFRYNATNASIDTGDWTILSNGSQTLQLNLGANNNIFYQFDFNGTGTGLISSYTINEGQAPAGASSSCSYGTGDWTIQGSEKCGLNTTNIGGKNIIFNGSGQVRILSNQAITNCSSVTLQNSADVTIQSGGRLC